MRWMYADHDGPAEAEQRARTLADIGDWWSKFANSASGIAASFSQGGDFAVAPFTSRGLQTIQDGLMWEYGPAVNSEGHRLCISAEGTRRLQPLIRTILDRAPSLPGWEFYSYRLSDSVANALSIASQVTGYQPQGDLQFRASINDSNRIDLTFAFPALVSEDDAARNFADKVTEHTAGDETLDKWIGVVDVTPQPGRFSSLLGRGRSGWLPLDRLKPTVDSLISAIRDQQESVPRHRRPASSRDSETWTSYQLTPSDPAGDSGDFPRFDDQFVFSSWDPKLSLACHSSGFSSERFTSSGETFAYLKIDHSAVDGDAMADWRGDLEESIDATLTESDIGCTFGGGSGLRYGYIDLALVDVRRAIGVLRDLLANRQEIGERSWMLFYDPELFDEWLGLSSTSPAPPAAGQDD